MAEPSKIPAAISPDTASPISEGKCLTKAIEETLTNEITGSSSRRDSSMAYTAMEKAFYNPAIDEKELYENAFTRLMPFTLPTWLQ